MTTIQSSHTIPIIRLQQCLHNEYLKCVLTECLPSDEFVSVLLPCVLSSHLFSTSEIKYTLYNSIVLIKILSFYQFGNWLLLWEKSPEPLNLKSRIEMFFHHWDSETAYSSLVYNEVFLDFNVFLINVLRISLLFFNLLHYLTRKFSPSLKFLWVLLRLSSVQNSKQTPAPLFSQKIETIGGKQDSLI